MHFWIKLLHLENRIEVFPSWAIKILGAEGKKRNEATKTATGLTDLLAAVPASLAPVSMPTETPPTRTEHRDTLSTMYKRRPMPKFDGQRRNFHFFSEQHSAPQVQ